MFEISFSSLILESKIFCQLSRGINSVSTSIKKLRNNMDESLPTYNRADGLRHIMNLMPSSVDNEEETDFPRSPSSYKCAAKHDNPPPTYAYIQIVFEIPPTYLR